MKKPYVVTEAAAPMTDVAGRRVRPGDNLDLTSSEAKYELLRGVIKPVVLEQPSPPAGVVNRKTRGRRS